MWHCANNNTLLFTIVIFTTNGDIAAPMPADHGGSYCLQNVFKSSGKNAAVAG